MFVSQPSLKSFHVASSPWGDRCYDGRPFWHGEPGLQGQGPWSGAAHFAVALADGACYRVDADTDNLSADEMWRYEEKVKEADRAEIQLPRARRVLPAPPQAWRSQTH